MKKEKIIKGFNGYLFLAIGILLFASGIYGIVNEILWSIILLVLGIFTLKGFFVVNSNTSMVLLLFGKYIGKCK